MDANLNGARLLGADLSLAIMDGAYMTRTNMIGAKMSWVDLATAVSPIASSPDRNSLEPT